MSGDLIERLRQMTAECARGQVDAVSCPNAREERTGWCNAQHRGHRCRYSDPPPAGESRHRVAQHECGCGEKWG